MSLKEESARRLKEARESIRPKVSQKRLAELCGDGWGNTRISAYETGRNRPDPDDAVTLVNALKKARQAAGMPADPLLTPAWLLAVDEVSEMPPDYKVLIQKYAGTDDRGKKAIQSVALAQPEANDNPPVSANNGA